MAKRKALGLIDEAIDEAVEGVKDLLFMHNTSAKKLARQEAIGGLPNPSIAVTQKDIPFEGFGEITLVGKPDRFDPALRGNPLYSADAYTVRAPSPVRVANKNAYKQFKSDYEAYRGSGNIDDVAYSLGDLESKYRIEPSDFRRVNDFLEYDNAAKLKFAQDNNIPVPKKENGDIDYYALSDVKSQNADKYEEWRQGEISKYFQPEEYFVTNPDYDRYSGRAKLQPYTAENVSKWMSKRAGAGQESTMTFGAGNVRASTTERIKSLEQARQMKGQLKPAEDMAEFKQTSDMMLGDLQDALKDYYQYDTNSFSYFDSVGEMIALSEKKGLKRAMEEVGFKDVPKELIQEIEDYKGYLRSAPTEYFESKPQRPVQLSDFGGAIVPENTPKGLIDRLTDAGLRVEKYGDEAERVAARDKFKDLMFVRPEAAITAGLLTAGALSSDRANAGLLSTGTKVARSVADETKRLIDMGYPESVAERIASGELDMSPDAVAKRKEAYPDQLYHGSMQDIQGEFTAGYGDGLLFFTPDPQFASNWVGKGKMQQRAGELDWHDRFKPQRQAVYDQLGRPEYGTPEYDEFERLTKPIRDQEMNAFKTVYPVRTRLLNTFDPTAEGAYENVTKPIFEKRFGGSIDPETERYLRQGSYMFYEDRDVVRELKKLGYDSMRLSEDSDGKLTTVAKFDPYDIKALGAAFDPEYVGPNILGNADPRLLAGLAGGSLLGAAVIPKDAEASVSGAVKQALDINYPRQVTVGEAKTPEANYNLLDAAVPAAIAYDYGNGANFPVRPAQGLLASEPEPKPEPMKLDTTMVPAGVPINPYTFMMSTGADQGEAARYVTDAYTNIARGTGNAIAGFGGEMETLGKGLMYALTGQGLGGSPWSRFMHVLNKYDPQLPNTQDVSQVPALLPNVSPMTEEERRMYQLAGEFLSPL